MAKGIETPFEDLTPIGYRVISRFQMFRLRPADCDKDEKVPLLAGTQLNGTKTDKLSPFPGKRKVIR